MYSHELSRSHRGTIPHIGPRAQKFVGIMMPDCGRRSLGMRSYRVGSDQDDLRASPYPFCRGQGHPWAHRQRQLGSVGSRIWSVPAFVYPCVLRMEHLLSIMTYNVRVKMDSSSCLGIKGDTAPASCGRSTVLSALLPLITTQHHAHRQLSSAARSRGYDSCVFRLFSRWKLRSSLSQHYLPRVRVGQPGDYRGKRGPPVQSTEIPVTM